ncbi:GntR family transcriptional regulator [Thermoflavimicrobium dichotomicum]|uniref:DNA-binding transcriptional regulator, GntR family n=1 Tax=Thermoflavimicrobium dichotomicum TaxID=46223 RepID=A0A1I3L2S6_9BACL|nr:GntR family transcriptional regulator [Thermoflavimicrobium dichotomicum]SFI79040.1 DNA-binding transcriptional regulator, GntR family [Thermoflavimicrobium dichotomicum]
MKSKRNLMSTRDYIYESLKDEIMSFRLVPGQSISEKEISDQFNVSRTPVREAFLRLSQEGLLDIYPQKGTVVSLIDLALMEEARFMREHLEKAVVREACKDFPREKLLDLENNLKMQAICMEEKDYEKLFHLDETFHETIFAGCNKSGIWEAMQPLNLHFKRSRLLRLATDLNWDVIYTQHVKMMEAIRDKQPEVAEKVMQEHLTLAIFEKEKLKQMYPNYFK